jgi:hypothetical protein
MWWRHVPGRRPSNVARQVSGVAVLQISVVEYVAGKRALSSSHAGVASSPKIKAVASGALAAGATAICTDAPPSGQGAARATPMSAQSAVSAATRLARSTVQDWSRDADNSTRKAGWLVGRHGGLNHG